MTVVFQRLRRPLLATIALLDLLGVAPSGRPTPLFSIGEGDARTHVAFETPQGLIAASVHVVVGRTASVGLNFFALQVDFDNGTWAHGGLQDVNGPGAIGAPRTRQVNWGGLVDRGGGNEDYDQADARIDLDRIQNPRAGRHVGPYPWKNDAEYELLVERGRRVTLPPGDYRLSPDEEAVRIDHPRKMWEWRFTVRPISEAGEPFVSVLYDASGAIDTLSVWNEAGYGSSDKDQLTRWSQPLYRTSAGGEARAPASWQRF